MEGFIPHIIGNTETTPFFYLPGTADEDFCIGQALKLASGKLTACSGTTKPEYICMQEYDSDVNTGLVCVSPVRDDIIYETHASEPLTAGSPAALLPIGSKVTIAGTPSPATYKAGCRVTKTTDSGVAEIVGIFPNPLAGADEDEANAIVYVKFA